MIYSFKQVGNYAIFHKSSFVHKTAPIIFFQDISCLLSVRPVEKRKMFVKRLNFTIKKNFCGATLNCQNNRIAFITSKGHLSNLFVTLKT